MKSFIEIYKAHFKVFLRNKKEIFWNFILPIGVIFLLDFILRGEKHNIRFVYIFPGILAAALMQLGVGGGLKFSSLRERNIIKGFSIIPFSRIKILNSGILLRIFMGLIQGVLIILLGIIIFGINLEGNLIQIFLIIFLGLLTFLSMGYMLIGLVKSRERGRRLAQIVQLTMIFLSGIFFPVAIMPDFIKLAARILPLTYLVDSLREIIVGIPGYFPLFINILILIFFLIFTFIFSIKFWSWE